MSDDAIAKAGLVRRCATWLCLLLATFSVALAAKASELEDGLAALYHDQFADAERLLSSAVDQAERSGGSVLLARALTARAQVLLEIGWLDRAAADARRALRVLEQISAAYSVDTARASLVLGGIA